MPLWLVLVEYFVCLFFVMKMLPSRSLALAVGYCNRLLLTTRNLMIKRVC